MSETDDAPSTGSRTPRPRLSRAVRRARETRKAFWRAFVVASFFVVVLAANLYVGAVVVVGSVQSHALSAVPGATGQTALVTNPMLDGIFCRYTVFDNNTARTIEDKVELCGTRGRVPSVNKSDFRWGGR